MKGGIAVAAIAALAGGANAIGHRHARAHELFAEKRGADAAESCECSVVTSYITGPPTLIYNPPPVTSVYSNTTTSSTSTPPPPPPPPTTTVTVHEPVPTPEPVTCPTPGTYTITATTVTLSETTTVCVGSSTHVPPGTHTVGGVTTVVETATTVTCPVATVSTSGSVVHSTIVETEYVCPSAGTYTIAPITVTVTEECDIDIPVPTTYLPGTYTAPEQVITVTETGYVTYCPYTSSGLPTTTPEPAPAPSSSAPPPPPPAPVSTSVAVEAPSPSPSAPSGGNGGHHFDGTLGTDGDHYGITYTPYNPDTGDCLSASAVEEDIAEIAADGFTVVRVYSTDCDTLPSVGAACQQHGVSMIIGIFVKETGCTASSPDIAEQIEAIAAWGQFDLVQLVVVGNEAIINGFCSASELAQLVLDVKETLTEYTGPYTIAETTNVWLDSSVTSAICDVVDFTGANIHPFFNAQTFPSLAGTFVQGQLDLLDAVCPGKPSINLECGWPTGGECNGDACPGLDAQAEALQSIRETCGGQTVFFSFKNDKWKSPGAFNCEQSWGSRDFFSLS